MTRHGTRARHLRIIELYFDRATDAWRSLRLQEADVTPGRFEMSTDDGRGRDRRARTALGFRLSRRRCYDFITVDTTARHKTAAPESSTHLDTRRARSEVRGQRAQSGLLARARRDRVERSESATSRSAARSFDLLIPSRA